MPLLQMTWRSRSLSGTVFSASETHGLLCPSFMLVSYCVPDTIWAYPGLPGSHTAAHQLSVSPNPA